MYVIGTTEGVNSNLDVCLLKYDMLGALVWTAIWNSTSNLDDIPLAITSDLNGNIVIVGGSEHSINQMDYLTLKYDVNGTLQWSSFYDYANDYDMAAAVEVNSNNQILVSGASASSSNNWDFTTILLENSNGNLTNSYRNSATGVGLDKVNAITIDDNNNLYLTGYTEANNQKDIQTVKLDANFNLVWVETFDGVSMDDVAAAIGLDDFGNVYITGYSEQANGISELLTIKYDANGTVEWMESYENVVNNGEVYATDLSITSQGEILITGSIENTTNKELLTLAYGKEGRLVWTKTNEKSNSDEEALEVISDNFGNIYVTGISNNGNVEQYTTVRYSTYERVRKPLIGVSSEDRLDNELIIQFEPSALINNTINNQEIIHGRLSDFINIQALNAIENKVGFKVADFDCFKVNPNLTSSNISSQTRSGNWITLPPFYATLVVVTPNDIDELALKDDLINLNQHISIVDLNHLYELTVDANDTYYQNGNSGGLVTPSSSTNSASINIEPAWDIEVGASNIKVGVFDTGINFLHQDFGNGTRNGSVVSDGFDYVNNQALSNTLTTDEFGHGSAIAGIIGAIRNNQFGIAGIAGGDDITNTSGVTIHDMKIFDRDPNYIINDCEQPVIRASVDNIEAGILDGIRSTNVGGYGQHIQNHSWAGPENSIIKAAFQSAFEHGVLMVVSSGNSGSAKITYPSNYNKYWILRVGANDITGDRAVFSNFDFDLDAIAPGTHDLYEGLDKSGSGFTDNEQWINPYGQSCSALMDGTSYAVPHFAGVGALMMSYTSKSTNASDMVQNEDCERLIEKYATDINVSGEDVWTGHGRLNAGNVLQHIQAPGYLIKHYNPIVSASVATSNGSKQVLISNWGGYINQSLTSTEYEVNVTLNHNIPSGYNVIDAWVRNGASDLAGEHALSNLQSIPSTPDIELVSFNNSQITLKGYIYELFDNNQSIGWYPYDLTSSIQLAYTLHLENPLVSNTNNKVKPDFLIYPQPSDDYFIIRLENFNISDLFIDLYAMDGRLVQSVQTSNLSNTSEIKVDVAHTPDGVYMVQIRNENQISTKKVIIQNR